MSSAGRFEIRVATGGYPVWCELLQDGEPLGTTFNCTELPDLLYAAKKAIAEARQHLRPEEQGQLIDIR